MAQMYNKQMGAVIKRPLILESLMTIFQVHHPLLVLLMNMIELLNSLKIQRQMLPPYLVLHVVLQPQVNLSRAQVHCPIHLEGLLLYCITIYFLSILHSMQVEEVLGILLFLMRHVFDFVSIHGLKAAWKLLSF
nr:hypothetical protein Iba_chr11aCG2300 [Ipomoea batatas]